jgi:tRNA U38,U39,U40 pseudouridine synthase TruA
MEPIRYRLAMEFSYWISASQETKIQAEECGERLEEAMLMAVNSIIQEELKDAGSTAEFVTRTQASIPRLRHRALAQEPGCFAAADVAVLSIMAPKGLVHREENIEQSEDRLRRFLDTVRQRANEKLKLSSNSDDKNLVIRLTACKMLPPDTRFHAERGCTQRAFHYLMPLRWLPDGKELERWWIENEILASNKTNEDADGSGGTHSNRASTRPPSDSLRVIKSILRSTESPRLDKVLSKDESDQTSIKMASGRFGNLSSKGRMPWHNFAAPSLRGDASPSNEPVWRVLDRARMIEMVRHQTHDGDERVAAVLEFRGDEFLPEQVRRIVGTAVAVTHGWLPKDMFETSRNGETFLETPIAPEGRLYLAESRFHFDELNTGGQSIFRTDKGGLSSFDPDHDSTDLLQHDILGSHRSEDTIGGDWLAELEATIAPRIRSQIERAQVHSSREDAVISPPLGDIKFYGRTFHLLQEIVSTGRWPDTSVARSSVIRHVNNGHSNTAHKRGSFTVVNPCFRDGLFKNGVSGNPLPLANDMFPDLTSAIFELELALAKEEIGQAEGKPALHPRPESSHCAVNCNAQFTPHVDSGRGSGQSLSMIVGLGDYSGGELAVEGEIHDIRYDPLEFDGWGLRHWTLPFAGERFSLVWFTPEMKSDKG